jgi:dethiobiotin synthetase
VTGRLLVVTGTGTGIGKTHFSEALLLTLGKRGVRVAGLKPVETGIDPAVPSDSERLSRASTFHVQHSLYRFTPPVSPHLAARWATTEIELKRIEATVSQARAATDLTLLELPGGLFTPLSESLLNIDAARALAPDWTLLIAPDRLGVLHETIATSRAAAATGLTLSAVALVSQATSDASIATNAAELLRFIPCRPIFSVSRGTPTELSLTESVVELANQIMAL